MQIFDPDQLPVALKIPGIEIRAQESEGGMTLLYYVFEKGAKGLNELLVGLPGDSCSARHWGYMIKGKLRYQFGDTHHDVKAGQIFYAAPGHTVEVLEDTEFCEVSPSHDLAVVGAHFAQKLAALAQAQQTSV